MTTDLATRVPAMLPEAVEQALVQGNLAELTPAQRVTLYHEVCSSLGLNPLTVPFQYIWLEKRLVLYALKNCTDQLRFIHNVNVEITSRERMDDIYVVTTRATLPNGRSDEEIGAVPIAGLKGEYLANALMKASTKAKRRVTLAIVGLSMLDETEVDSIRAARQPKFQVIADHATGEITEQGQPPAPQPDRTPDDEAREILMDGWAAIWNQANSLGLQVPSALSAGKMSNAELQKAGAELKAKVLAEMDRRNAAPAPAPEPEPVPA